MPLMPYDRVAPRQARTAQPEPPSFRLMPQGAFIANSVAPAKPINRPAERQRLKGSLNHSQATSAPNKGAVLFRIDDKPVLSCISA